MASSCEQLHSLTLLSHPANVRDNGSLCGIRFLLAVQKKKKSLIASSFLNLQHLTMEPNKEPVNTFHHVTSKSEQKCKLILSLDL